MLGSRLLLLTLGYRTGAKTGMEKILELLQFFCVFLKKMHFLTLGSALSFFLSCTVYILTERKKRIKRTIFMQKAVDKQRRNQYCIKERIQNITGKEAPS